MKAKNEALAILSVFADGTWHSYCEVEAAVNDAMCRRKAIARYLAGRRRPRTRPLEVQVAMGIQSRILCHLSNLKRSQLIKGDGLKSIEASWQITIEGQQRLAELTKETV